MSEVMAAWIAAVCAIVAIMGSIGAVYVALAQRITRLETFFEVLGRKAAQVLHSPHTPELDHYLEKYISGKMDDSDWLKLLQLVEVIEVDLKNPKAERALAGFISVHCRKRLGLKMPGIHRHDETTSKEPDTDKSRRGT
jgi:hypothetical protein